MISILLISQDNNSLSGLSAFLGKQNNVDIYLAGSGSKALTMISGRTFDLAVVDEDLGDMAGLDFVKEMILINPMVNSAVVSSLSQKDFHEASEGLGVMTQLSPKPGEGHAEEMLHSLKRIINFTSDK